MTAPSETRISHEGDTSGIITSFKEFADACETIEWITSSLEMTTVVSSLLQKDQ